MANKTDDEELPPEEPQGTLGYDPRMYQTQTAEWINRLPTASQERSSSSSGVIDTNKATIGSEDWPYGKAPKTLKNHELNYAAKKALNKLRDGHDLPDKRLNILLVGKSGVGKSAFCNSLLMAINKKGYENVAERGGYGEGGFKERGAVTLSIKGLHLFSLLPQGSAELSYACQPYIYDIPGVEDIDDENIGTILRLVIEGKLIEGANMRELLGMKARDLRKHTTFFAQTDKKIHIVVFVHAATDPIPENLLAVVNDATRPDQKGERTLPVFGLVTKIDMLPERHLLPRIVSDLAEKICASGAEERVFCSPLYSNAVTPNYERHEAIDKVMSDVWTAILKRDVAKPINESKGFLSNIFG